VPFWITWQSGADFILANREMTKNSYGNTRPDSGKADIRPILKRYRGRCRRRNETVSKLDIAVCLKEPESEFSRIMQRAKSTFLLQVRLSRGQPRTATESKWTFGRP
jgi:hypothetical protein